MVKVVLCGDSLVLAALRASLGGHPAIELVQCRSAAAADLLAALDLEPAAIIFDLLIPPFDLPISLLKRRAGLLLIGIEPDTHELLALSGCRVAEPTTRDLADLITRIGPARPCLNAETPAEEDLK